MELKKTVDSSFLPYVNKPARYLGNEHNVIIKQPEAGVLRIALCFPDLYEAGIRSLGFEQLYHALNAIPQVWAERVYAPASDGESLMRRHTIPLFALESKTALADFRALCFYVPERLTYTNILNMLDLGGIPFRSAARPPEAPLVLGVGPVCDNPEPLAEFMDGFIFGDLPAVWETIAGLLRESPPGDRQTILTRLSALPGIYIPSYYQPSYSSFREFQGLRKRVAAVPDLIRPAVSARQALPANGFAPLIPLGEMNYTRTFFALDTALRVAGAEPESAPVRSATPSVHPLEQALLEEVQKMLPKYAGDRSARLMSRDRAFCGNGWLAVKEAVVLGGQKISAADSVVRLNLLQNSAANLIPQLKQSEFVIWAYTGGARLRKVLNVNYREAELLDLIRAVFENGWPALRLNFMIGLPTEKSSDIHDTAELMQKCLALLSEFPERQLRFAVSGFSPRPHSPFQWEKQESAAQLHQKYDELCNYLGAQQAHLDFQDPEITVLETVFARGDRQLAEVLEIAWKNGARFDYAAETLRTAAWQRAFEQASISRRDYLMPISVTVPLPWDHIDPGISRAFLKTEKLRAYQAELYPGNKSMTSFGTDGLPEADFRRLLRQAGGGQPGAGALNSTTGGGAAEGNTAMQYGRRGRKVQMSVAVIKHRVRIRYSKIGGIRFLAHPDMMRIFERSAQLAKIPLVYSQGQRRNPKIAYGPPLPAGIASTAEYVDLELEIGREVDLQHRFNAFLPEGVEILQYQGIHHKTPALASVINRATYEVVLSGAPLPAGLLDDWLAQSEVRIKRINKDGTRDMDIRQLIQKAVLNNEVLSITIDSIEGKTVKIIEVLESLLEPHGIDYRQYPIQRTGQYVVKEDGVYTPFDIL